MCRDMLHSVNFQALGIWLHWDWGRKRSISDSKRSRGEVVLGSSSLRGWSASGSRQVQQGTVCMKIGGVLCRSSWGFCDPQWQRLLKSSAWSLLLWKELMDITIPHGDVPIWGWGNPPFYMLPLPVSVFLCVTAALELFSIILPKRSLSTDCWLDHCV